MPSMSDPDKVKFSDQTGLSFQNYYQLSADEHPLFYLVVHHITHCHHIRTILFVLELGSLFRSNSSNCQFKTHIFLHDLPNLNCCIASACFMIDQCDLQIILTIGIMIIKSNYRKKNIFTCTHETPSCTVEHCMLKSPKQKASISDNGAHTSKYVRTNLFLSRLRTHFKIQKLMVLPSLDSLVVFCIFSPQNFKLFFQVLDVCCVQKYQSSRSLSSVLNQAFASILIWRHSLFRLTHATCAIHA